MLKEHYLHVSSRSKIRTTKILPELGWLSFLLHCIIQRKNIGIFFPLVSRSTFLGQHVFTKKPELFKQSKPLINTYLCKYIHSGREQDVRLTIEK